MKRLKISDKAQSILEYVIILTAILAAVIFGTRYIKTSLIGENVTSANAVPETSLFGRTGKVITDFTGRVGNIGTANTGAGTPNPSTGGAGTVAPGGG